MNFREELNQRTAKTEEIIMAYLPHVEGHAFRLSEAMSYSLTAGGKRLRPLLMKEVYEIFGGQEKVIEPFMAGMEMIHTHSLIHDDLPALDNDDLRRGKPTVHKVFGEACAILAGDALLNYAYETMLGGFGMTRYPDRVVKALCLIAEKTGIQGMLGGQSVDVENDGKPLRASVLEYIYEKKTSALLEASMQIGAILAGASENACDVIGLAASNIGLAFQIRDDILDLISTDQVLGKPVHSDEKNLKTTYVTLNGLEKAEARVKELTQTALDALRFTGRDITFLCSLVESLAVREK
ncbi:MAG: polyprenyl synthetase family protein [Blautia sp.]|nr:polyprenyl synthetase family protein [Blautia sp.]